MKFSPVLPFALSSLITTSLAAPHALRQPAPRSAAEPMGRRSSATGLLPVAAPAAPAVQSSNIDHVIDFGMGTPLLSARNNAKRSDNEKRYTSEEASQMIGFGTGEDLQLVKEKRSDNEKRYTTEEASQMIGFDTGEDLQLVKEKRTDLGNPGQQSSTELAASAIGFGTGETLAPVSMSSLAVRDDPLIRRKVAELAALIKERSPEASIHDVLIREASPIPDVAAPAA